jgi:hypothetical protein
MKIYVTSRFRGSAENKNEIERLCLAVRNAGMEDFHFVRDIEHYQLNFFLPSVKCGKLPRYCIDKCDALLIDVSDAPGSGRIVEVGIA